MDVQLLLCLVLIGSVISDSVLTGRIVQTMPVLMHGFMGHASKNRVDFYAIEVTVLFYCDFEAKRMDGMCFV